MRVIIMADGKATRWGGHEGVPKHLIKIDNETLLARSVRLLREQGVEDIVITTHNQDYATPGARLYAPENNTTEIDKFLAPHPIWDEHETIMLYGDCYFTQEAIQAILGTPCKRFMFFGRYGASEKTGKKWGEIFALKFKDKEVIRAACQDIKDNHGNPDYGRCGAWQLYRYMEGIPLLKHEVQGSFVEIDDLTDDFDFPKDLDIWLETRRLAMKQSLSTT